MSERKAMIFITGCSDPLMWYADKIGQYVPFVREEEDLFWSIEGRGYTNTILACDAEIRYVTPKTQQLIEW